MSAMEPSQLLLKCQQQARRLVEQQQQLQCALKYGQLAEKRIAQLAPGHALPLTPDCLDSPPPAPPAPAAAAAAPTAKPPQTRSRPSSGAASGASSLEGLRLERAKLQQALAAQRQESERREKVAEREAKEARRALEEAARAAGLPNGGGAILQAHAASERKLGELAGTLAEAERRERALAAEAEGLREQLRLLGTTTEQLAATEARATRAEEQLATAEAEREEIGRASCRERVLPTV